MPEVMKRVEAVRQFRLKSTKAATVKLASMPYLFAEIRQPVNNYILIPIHSSENRLYVPITFFGAENIVHNSSTAIPNATPYHFGVISSLMHMAWMRAVCGRIKSDYRYSNNIVYNNFPWPGEATPAQKARVESAAQSVLAARQGYPDSSLADLYDPAAMPKPLVDAHRALDKAVDLCYRPQPFATELERLEYLFGLYRQLNEPMLLAMEPVKPKRKK
jgi:hypothetical protein